MNNLLEKIKATTLRQRLIIGGVFLILIGFGTATIVHHQNVVSEAKNKILKVEFIYQNKFESLDDLELQLAEYIYWYNHIRIHQ